MQAFLPDENNVYPGIQRSSKKKIVGDIRLNVDELFQAAATSFIRAVLVSPA